MQNENEMKSTWSCLVEWFFEWSNDSTENRKLENSENEFYFKKFNRTTGNRFLFAT